MINKLMISWCIICLAVTVQMRDRWRDLEDGDVLAWSVHITGQDTDDLTVWDDFKSVATINANSTKASGDVRYDDEVWVVVDRTIDGNDYKFIEQFQSLDWGDDPNYCWFVDCALKGNSEGVAEIPEQSGGTSRTTAYFTGDEDNIYWFDENWNYVTTSDIPDTGYDNTVVAATEDGTKVVAGWNNTYGTYPLGEFDIDLNVTYPYEPDGGWPKCWIRGLGYSADDEYLYVHATGYIWKFKTSDRSMVYQSYSWPYGGGSEMAVDKENDILYTNDYLSGGFKIHKWDGSDGSRLTGAYGVSACAQRFVVYDSVNDYVLTGGIQFAAGYENITLLDSTPTKLAGYIDNGQAHNAIVHNGYYYVVKQIGDDGYRTIKLDTSLNLIAGSAYGGEGIVVDWDGHITVCDQDNLGGNIWIFDDDLNLLDHKTFGGSLPFFSPQLGSVIYTSETIDAIPGREPNYSPGVANGLYACVYADGRPIGQYDTITDANGTILVGVEDTYEVVIAGLNYYSIYESFPINLAYGPGWTSGFNSSIKDIKIDFYESMGCNVGVSIDDSVDWIFSYDDFATAIDPVTEIKRAPFIWGITREPIIYLWEWNPIPMTVRGIYPHISISMD